MLPHSYCFNFLCTFLSRQSHIVIFCLPNIPFYDFFITCHFEIVLFKHLTYKRARYHLIFHALSWALSDQPYRQQRWIPRLPPTLQLNIRPFVDVSAVMTAIGREIVGYSEYEEVE